MKTTHLFTSAALVLLSVAALPAQAQLLGGGARGGAVGSLRGPFGAAQASDFDSFRANARTGAAKNAAQAGERASTHASRTASHTAGSDSASAVGGAAATARDGHAKAASGAAAASQAAATSRPSAGNKPTTGEKPATTASPAPQPSGSSTLGGLAGSATGRERTTPQGVSAGASGNADATVSVNPGH